MKRAVTLRALLLEDAARTAESSNARRPAVARLLRRADLGREDIASAAVDLRTLSACSAALALLAGETAACTIAALDVLCASTGLSREEWITATLLEQRVELADGEVVA